MYLIHEYEVKTKFESDTSNRMYIYDVMNNWLRNMSVPLNSESCVSTTDMPLHHKKVTFNFSEV